MMNGKKLNGSMLAGLIENYLVAINQGAVPNIENAWSYLCKNECQKALQKSIEIFEEEFRSNFEVRVPLYEDELREIFNDAKAEALDNFNSKALGEVQSEYEQDLIIKFDQKFSQYRAENENESRKSCQIFLQNCYTQIEDQLRNQQYKSFIDFERDIQEFQQAFLDNGPPGPNRKSIMLEFCLRALVEGCDFFIQNLSNEVELTSKLNEESVSKLEKYQQELKTELTSTKEIMEQKLRAVESDKAHIAAREQTMRDQMVELKKDKEELEKEFRGRMEQEKQEAHRLVEEYKSKSHSVEEESKDMQRRVMQSESEFDKQKALLDLKIDHLEQTVDSLKKKESSQSDEIKSQKKELLSSLKDNSSKYENQVKELNEKVETLTENLQEKESDYSELEQQFKFDSDKWTDKERQLTSDLNLAQTELSGLKQSNSDLSMELDTLVSSKTSAMEDELDQLRIDTAELTEQLKEKSRDYDNLENRREKEVLIIEQKLEFAEKQIEEVKNQKAEDQKTYQQMIQAIDQRDKDRGAEKAETDMRIDALNSQHMKELKELEEQLENKKKRLSDELEESQRALNEMSVSTKINNAEMEKENKDLGEQVAELSATLKRLTEENEELESNKTELVEKTTSGLTKQIRALEAELEEKKESSQLELTEIQDQSENSLKQMKQFYEQQNERNEQKLKTEKTQSTEKINRVHEDYENRLREEQNNHEEEIEMLQEDIRNKEVHINGIEQQFDQQMNLKEQKIQQLEAHMADLKSQLNDIQGRTSAALDSERLNFKNERKALSEKCDDLMVQLKGKEREVATLSNNRQYAEENLKKKADEVEEFRLEFLEERKQANEKIEALRAENQEVNNEYTKSKLDWGRDEALKNQQIEFQGKKVEDLMKQITEGSMSYEEKLKSIKDEHGQDVSDRVTKMQEDKEKYEKKYNEK